MNKITPEHLARGAYIYVRQSTADQLLHNHESRRRQYGLGERARQLGWSDATIIDDDLGRSGSGTCRKRGTDSWACACALITVARANSPLPSIPVQVAA